jgi:ammonium transporter, Amt family
MSGPTRGAREATETWTANPLAAFGLKVAAYGIPLVVAWLVLRVAAPFLWRPAGWVGLVLWILQGIVVGTVVSSVTERQTRRILPLAALMGMSMVFPDQAPLRAIPGHSIPFAILGCFVLLVGWYGFNPGSELAADSAIGGIAVTTTAAGAMGAITAMITIWIRSGKPDVGMTGNGLLAGLVAITAGCAAVTPQAALIIGGIAGVLVVFAVSFFDNVAKIDDPVGAISVHGVCGAFGTICVGLFAREDAEGFWQQGLLYGGGTDQLITQILGVLAIIVWVSITSFILFQVLHRVGGLRVSREEELAGLDVEEHGSPGYGEGFGSFSV